MDTVYQSIYPMFSSGPHTIWQGYATTNILVTINTGCTVEQIQLHVSCVIMTLRTS